MIRHGDEHYRYIPAKSCEVFSKHFQGPSKITQRSVLDLVLLALLLSCGLRPAQGAVVGEVHSGTPCSAQTSSNGSCSSSALYKCAVACHANETCRAFVWEAETGHCYAHDHQKASGDNRFGPHNTLGDTVANINISSYDQSVRFACISLVQTAIDRSK
ncbi:hypothetical protein WJX75_007978 [Coccomyxa subellipsoidea]|uniref:Apple domain-containing protein n=1 Tax=Coccomyxa subellipsoidea TaxID=248742 RepID=A0ABR2YLC2_9CHLO